MKVVEASRVGRIERRIEGRVESAASRRPLIVPRRLLLLSTRRLAVAADELVVARAARDPLPVRAELTWRATKDEAPHYHLAHNAKRPFFSGPRYARA